MRNKAVTICKIQIFQHICMIGMPSITGAHLVSSKFTTILLKILVDLSV